jgi:hypothetical protein
MTLPPLPSRAADAWEIGPAFENRGTIFGVSAHAGRVLVGGDGLHRLRAGAQGWQHRKLPPRISAAWTVAQEPWAPWRQAVASEEGVAVFLGNEGTGRIAHLRPADDDVYVTNLAWGRAGGRSALFVNWNNGEVLRVFPEKGEKDTLDLPYIAGLAGDSNGSVAMVASESACVYVIDGGEGARFRAVEEVPQEWRDAAAEDDGVPFHLAVAGKAVALSFGWAGAFVTRDVESLPFEKCEPLSLAGALAFEGASPDAALFGALATEAFTTVVRVDASGQAVRLGDMSPVSGRAFPFDELAWDATRHRLFAVHRQAGLVVVTAPDAKGGKLAPPN